MEGIILKKGKKLIHQRFAKFNEGKTYPYALVNFFDFKPSWITKDSKTDDDSYAEYSYTLTKDILLLDLRSDYPQIKMNFTEENYDMPRFEYRHIQIALYLYNYDGVFYDGIALPIHCDKFLKLVGAEMVGDVPSIPDQIKIELTDCIDMTWGLSIYISKIFLWSTTAIEKLKQGIECDESYNISPIQDLYQNGKENKFF